jgi:hypothetical protein
MAVRVSALHAGRPLPPGRFPVLFSVRGWVDPRATVQLEGLGLLKNPITLTLNNTQDCSSTQLKNFCSLFYSHKISNHVQRHYKTPFKYIKHTVFLSSFVVGRRKNICVMDFVIVGINLVSLWMMVARRITWISYWTPRTFHPQVCIQKVQHVLVPGLVQDCLCHVFCHMNFIARLFLRSKTRHL